MNKSNIILIALFFSLSPIYAQQDIQSTRIETPSKIMEQYSIYAGLSVRQSVDDYGNLYIRAWSSLSPVLTFVNKDGTVTICASDESIKITYVYELTSDLEIVKMITFENELEKLGAFSKDDEGNYYFIYACYAQTKTTENMAVVKYDKEGEKINVFKLAADPKDGFSTIKEPFYAGTCRLELSGSLLAVYFAHQRFDGHQASFGFVIDKNTFQRVDRGSAYYYQNGTYPKGINLMPFSGHSMNQFILPIENGFIFADHGDGYPRAFTFGKFQKGEITVRLNAFRFPGSTGANATYAQMGGLAKTTDGFIFAGTYGTAQSNPRNLFILTFDDNLTKCSTPVYLTRYTKNDGHAGHPKIISMENGNFLVLWEQFLFSTQSANTFYDIKTGYISTFAMIINEKGESVSETIELKNIRLNMNDVPRFNSHNGKIYWAIINDNKSITVYSMTITE